MRLIYAPIGVFRFNGDLVLKTEYMVDIDGVWIPDCYILDSGEKFWGGMKSKDDFKTKYNDLEVEVVDVEPQRMRGRWIGCGNSDHWKCSVCGTRAAFWFSEESSSEVDLDMSEWLSDFCPNCGADMRGGQADAV